MQPNIIELGNGFFNYVNILSPNPNGVSNVINIAQKSLLEKITSGVGFEALTQAEQSTYLLMEKNGIIGQKDFLPPKYPRELSFWFHLTNRCTLRCTYCHVWKENTDMTADVLEQVTKQFVQTAVEMKLKKITLRMAGGEPSLMFSKIESWLEDLRVKLSDVNCELAVAFLCGLASMPKAFLKYITDRKAGISVSLDGINKYQDDARPLVNGRGSFENVQSNVLKLIENGISPFIMSVISNKNINGLVDFTKWLIKHNLGFRFAFVKGEELNRDDVAKQLAICYDLLEEAVLDGRYTKFHQHRLSDTSFHRPINAPCGAGRSTASIYVDGGIYLCQIEHEEGEQIGSVFNENNLVTTMVDRSTQTDFITQGEKCGSCKWRYNCAGGCPYDKMEDGRSMNCGLFHQFIPRVYQIQGKQKLKTKLGDQKFDSLFRKSIA